MSATNHYHDRIHRATERLAQLQAKELLANQRQAVKTKETQRREEAKRRTRVAEIVFLAGAEALEDNELLGALLAHVENRNDHATRNHASSLGALRMAITSAEEGRKTH
ncbi:conjugal transfer protein TraD [Xanthomonas hortorum pv. gardneri]|uniref:Conjugal transfer protein TraD n=1 Tax=Xanthomonas hortorum pv. vitians TaxID=83224 RepID=A0A6V7DBE6_9XANT|nr:MULTISPECIES: conjugal transfer protein TraD [Xanthomonas]MEB1146823.1 conjugal transfer protein TraD [Xanthomonas campestris pv. campestris]MCC5074272.1 conjugal transfer protein TraD [Xanthomonas campestris pv. plantaginis]MCC8493748.1 conjugal transfer protein TraD [Xanthomonas hortorum pv. gardneri]MCE4304769.1 conjugal transfer protein TraD [Xanthomonas hortorum pv. vitians]MCE4527836.1 conjugal transfer protein TraD [Xanthomonas hortorum pv. vitians]